MAASDDALDLTADHHQVATAVVSDDSFELTCSCGWASASASGVDILDAWSDHCLTVGRSDGRDGAPHPVRRRAAD